VLVTTQCAVPNFGRKTENKKVPESYGNSKDSTNTAKIKWRDFFNDQNLKDLIDTALRNNQELNIVLQEINISKNEIKARKGAYLPFVGVGTVVGADKVGKHTSQLTFLYF